LPARSVRFVVPDHLTARADPGLVRILLQNLLGNAFKFTARKPGATIELGAVVDAAGERTFFVRDDGVGFEASQASEPFAPFRRLHADPAFPGMGIGLATAQRIVERHGGRIWAEAAAGRGATFYWTLGENKEPVLMTMSCEIAADPAPPPRAERVR
jgi:signal transduction histidine kinase